MVFWETLREKYLAIIHESVSGTHRLGLGRSSRMVRNASDVTRKAVASAKNSNPSNSGALPVTGRASGTSNPRTMASRKITN